MPSHQTQQIRIDLDKEVDRILAKGLRDFISGAALGFDQIAASHILEKREIEKNIRLIFALPCKVKDGFWNETQKMRYHALLNRGDEIVYVSKVYDEFSMRRRNETMVRRSQFCICVFLHEKSGTAQTARFARENGWEIVHVARESSQH